jgi:tRNA pseudouridine55 synthase
MARRKQKGRAVNGVLLLDKPAGISSNRALQQVKHLFHAAKAGHTGSLDPLATGMLPLCFGEATKISAFLLDADKRYRMSCKLGVTTDTGDADGTVLQTRDCNATLADVEKLLPDFIGAVEQIPPMYSALKHQGQRLYKLAREGIEVERKPRTIQIHELKIHALEHDVLDIEVACSKGTYVRTLAEDMGERLGCGAHVVALRRLSVGPYHGNMVTMEQLQALADDPVQGLAALDRLLLPIESGVADWPDVRLEANAAFYMRQGQPILVAHAPTHGWVRIYGQDRFLGVGEIQDDGRVAPRRLIQSDVNA